MHIDIYCEITFLLTPSVLLMQEGAALDDSSDEDEVNVAEMADFMDPGDFYKMVFVVNSDLGMGVGKVAAQVVINVFVH